MASALRSKAWIALKKRGAATLDDIQADIGNFPKKDIARILDIMIKTGHVERRGDTYHILRVIDPKLPQDWKQKQAQKFSFERIQRAGTIPEKWMNPLVDSVVHRSQGDRGTCVGQSTAYGRDFDLLRLSSVKPSEEEMKAFKADVAENMGQCTIVHDIMFDRWSFSAGFCYWSSRDYGHVTVPSGSYLDVSVAALKVNGACLERDFYTSTTTYCAPDFYPYKQTQEQIKSKAKLHRIDGYATVNSFDSIKQAIYTHGYVLMPIDIYANYTDGGSAGLFPDPGGECVGSHALCWIGYDEDNLYCIHSWRGAWSKIGGISRRYYNYQPYPGFVILDNDEKLEADKIYRKVYITSNVAANITINGVTYPLSTSASAAFEEGTFVKVFVTPVSSELYEPSSIEWTCTLAKEDVKYNCTFTKRDIKKSIRDMIREMMKKYFPWK